MELIQQLEAWNKAHKFSQGIAAIEAIPEEERGFLLTLWLGRLYSNLAVLGDYDQRVFTDSRERVYQQERDERLMRKAIDILLTVQKEGEQDPTWNSRMAYVLWAMEGRWKEAAVYAQRWLELAPEDPDAQQLMAELRENLLHLEKGKNKY